MMGMPLFRVWSLFLLFGMLTICISKIIYTNENEEERMTDKGKSKTSDTVTMKDVAALANVSIATVSRFLNGDLSRMSTNTAKTVKSAIDKLNYVPNSAARQMVTKSSGLIAIIVANIDDFFSTELFKGISAMLESKGYVGVLFDSNSDVTREKELMTIVSTHTFDGLIIQPFSSVKVISDTIRRNIPIVIVDREIEQSPWTQVVTNNYEAARNAAKYFRNEGFTHAIVVTSNLNLATNRRERYRGILSEIDNTTLVEVSESSYNHKKVSQLLEKLLKDSKEKTLIFALKERWITEFVPSLFYKGYIDNKRVAITGFADTSLAKYIDPHTKLIAQNPYLMGASAAEVMTDKLTNMNVRIDNTIVVPAKFE